MDTDNKGQRQELETGAGANVNRAFPTHVRM